MTAQQVEALPEPKAQEVLSAWVKAGRTELPSALRESASKAHARLAKKALYQLQSSGVTVEEKRVESPEQPAPPTNPLPAVLSHQLGTGERAFFFAVPLRGGTGLEVFQGVVHDEFGIAQIGSEKANRQQYRKRMKELETDPNSQIMLVPFERLQLELGRAMTLNERTKTEYGTDITLMLERLKVTPQDPDVVIPPLEAGDDASRDAALALHELAEVKEWMPSEPDLVVLSSQVSALDVLPMDEAKKLEKKETLAKSLAEQIFTPAVRLVYARRLWYSAELFDNRGRPADAALARAEARRLAHETTPSRFAEQLFVKVVPSIKQPSAAALLGKR